MKALIVPILIFVGLLPVSARAQIDIQEVHTPGGLTAWLVEEPSIPFVALELRFQGGASLDTPGKRGAINLMVALLEEGTGDLDANAFARATEALAAEFSFSVRDDAAIVSARFLSDMAEEAISLLRGALVEPSFSQEALDRVRAQTLSIIASDETDPNKIAGRVFDSLAFGDHPYGTPKDGTRNSVLALARADIVAAHRAVFARNNLYISAVGDIDAKELASLLDRFLSDLPETGALMPVEATYALGGGQTLVDFDTPQSVALFGHSGLARDHPDFIAAYVLNDIFGGSGLTSRLSQEVRENRGLTYGVYSYLVPKDHAALIMGSVASSNDRIAETIAVIREEWARMGKDGVTEKELQSAKTFLTGAYPLRFDGNRTIANILVGMQMDALGRDYVRTRNQLIEALTLKEINRVARDLMRPEDLHFVVVGRPVERLPDATQ